MIKKNICFEVCHICTVSALVPFIHNLGEERGESFFFAERKSRRKNCSLRMESKEKEEEGNCFSFAERKSRRKNCSSRIESKEKVQRGEVFSLQRRRAGGKIVP
jgi:hypothetical protein